MQPHQKGVQSRRGQGTCVKDDLKNCALTSMQVTVVTEQGVISTTDAVSALNLAMALSIVGKQHKKVVTMAKGTSQQTQEVNTHQ